MLNLFFQHPGLLGLLALAGLPLLVHLLSRARPPIYRFSSIEFLHRILRRTARIRRPKDRVLLALRTLALAALAMAFVSPVLISKNAAMPGEKSTVILLVDRSASMAAREGAGSRFEIASAEAASFLEKSKPSSANLVWIDAAPDSVFPEPGPNLDFLTDTLKQAEPLPEAGALEAAFDLALRQLAQGTGRREIVILSDFQASAWKNFSPKLPPDVTLHTRRVATSSPPNVAVTHLMPQSSEPVLGQDLSILARVRNFSPDPIRSQLTLDAGGARQSQPINLPPWGEAEAAFTLHPAAAGPLPITVRSGADALPKDNVRNETDAFPMDDVRHALVRVRDSLALALETPPDSSEAVILRKIADALPWLEIAENSNTSRQPDLRFISPWDGSNPAALRESAASGHTLIVRPSPTCPPAALQTLLGLPANEATGAFNLANSPNGWTVVPEESHPAIRLFRNGDFGNPFAGKFRERIRLPESLGSSTGARLIARYSDGMPALVEYPTKSASILLWNLSLDPTKTDWPAQGAFLPTVAEIVLRTRPNATIEAGQGLPGSLISWSSSDPAHAGAVRLSGPADESLAVSESNTASGTLWQSKQPATPGLYRWQISGQTIDYTAVNFPDSESDLRPLDASPAFGNLASTADSLVRQAALAQGLPIWQWLAIAALAFLMLESLIHSYQPKNR